VRYPKTDTPTTRTTTTHLQTTRDHENVLMKFTTTTFQLVNVLRKLDQHEPYIYIKNNLLNI